MSQTSEPTDEHYRLFGKLLVSWREHRGMTQQGAARRPGAPSDTTLASIEAGTWRSRNAVQMLRKVDAAMGWPPGIAKAFMYEAREEDLRDEKFLSKLFADLDAAAAGVEYATGIGGMPTNISLGSAAHDRAVQLIADTLPVLRLSDLAAVAMVIRSMLTQRDDAQTLAPVRALDEVIHGLPTVDPSQQDSLSRTATTGRVSWLMSTQDRLAARDKVVDQLAAHDETHPIEDEQLGDDTP